MGLKEESTALFVDMFGPEIAKALDGFDDPAKYPDAYVEQCIYFLSNLIGDEAAKKKFEPIARKYLKERVIVRKSKNDNMMSPMQYRGEVNA